MINGKWFITKTERKWVSVLLRGKISAHCFCTFPAPIGGTSDSCYWQGSSRVLESSSRPETTIFCFSLRKHLNDCLNRFISFVNANCNKTFWACQALALSHPRLNRSSQSSFRCGLTVARKWKMGPPVPAGGNLSFNSWETIWHGAKLR